MISRDILGVYAGSAVCEKIYLGTNTFWSRASDGTLRISVGGQIDDGPITKDPFGHYLSAPPSVFVLSSLIAVAPVSSSGNAVVGNMPSVGVSTQLDSD